MSKKRILVIDDDEIILELLSIILSDEGYEVTDVDDAEKALEILEDDIPDLVLLDIMMPKIDGSQVLSEIRKNDRTKNLPVILISSSHEISAVAEEFGADEYISKPIDLEKLEVVIKSYISNHKT